MYLIHYLNEDDPYWHLEFCEELWMEYLIDAIRNFLNNIFFSNEGSFSLNETVESSITHWIQDNSDMPYQRMWFQQRGAPPHYGMEMTE